jgi:hypothetical protein
LKNNTVLIPAEPLALKDKKRCLKQHPLLMKRVF